MGKREEGEGSFGSNVSKATIASTAAVSVPKQNIASILIAVCLHVSVSVCCIV